MDIQDLAQKVPHIIPAIECNVIDKVLIYFYLYNSAPFLQDSVNKGEGSCKNYPIAVAIFSEHKDEQKNLVDIIRITTLAQSRIKTMEDAISENPPNKDSISRKLNEYQRATDNFLKYIRNNKYKESEFNEILGELTFSKEEIK